MTNKTLEKDRIRESRGTSDGGRVEEEDLIEEELREEM